MTGLRLGWTEFWTNFVGVVTNTASIVDLLDIAVVAYIIYQGIRLVRETRALQLVRGIAGILALYLAATWLNMITLTFLLNEVLRVGLFALVVLFQPELRRALEQMGRTKFPLFEHLSGRQDTEEQKRRRTLEAIEAVVLAAEELSRLKTGALMVMERDIRLGEIIKTGTELDAMLSPELIGNIFFHNAPLHDGAMVIRDNRVHAASCYLPLSNNMDIARELGTRHRAALGLSEVSDALIVVVSEETGAISVAIDAKLQRKLSPQNLQKLLTAKLLPEKKGAAEKGKKGFFRKDGAGSP